MKIKNIIKAIATFGLVLVLGAGSSAFGAPTTDDATQHSTDDTSIESVIYGVYDYFGSLFVPVETNDDKKNQDRRGPFGIRMQNHNETLVSDEN